MDFFAQVGVALVVLLIFFIILKSNKDLKEVYLESQKQEEDAKFFSEKESEKKPRVERSQHTVLSKFSQGQTKESEDISYYCIWTIDEGGRLEEETPVLRYPFRIGREEDNDLCLSDGSVSSHHAEIVEEASEVWLRDCDSLNGIILNGHRVEEAKLEDGTCVFLGNTEIYFQKMER